MKKDVLSRIPLFRHVDQIIVRDGHVGNESAVTNIVYQRQPVSAHVNPSIKGKYLNNQRSTKSDRASGGLLVGKLLRSNVFKNSFLS